MSKKIDFSAPLSEEDEAYVAERPWLRIDAELSGFDLSDETDLSVDSDESEIFDPGVLQRGDPRFRHVELDSTHRHDDIGDAETGS